jgi:catechol 2,3-dioxygenase-like lactoylglutathione lyase family enzyme
MFHSTAMVRDYDGAVARLAELFGLRVLEQGDAPDPAIGRRGGMSWVGDGSIEIGEPIVDGAPPDRFVKRTGGGMQGVAVWVEDLDATVSHLASLGVNMPVQLDHFGFSSPSGTAGLQFEWSAFTVKEDPRAGAPEPPFVVEPLVPVTHHAFVGAVVDAPEAAAAQLAAIIGTRVTFITPDAPIGAPVAGVDLGDCTLALYRLAREESPEIWGRQHDRPRVSAFGLRVDDLDQTRAALRDASVRLLRDDGGALVVDPRDTGDIEVVIVDDLLPGDPRR